MEIVLGSLVLAIAIAAILGASLGQMALQSYARNLWLTTQDANRVTEQIRQENRGCAVPSVRPPGGFTSWDAWLADPARGKGLASANPNVEELIVVTCSDPAGPDGTAARWCGTGNQVGTGEWSVTGGTTTHDPLRVTIAVCWRERGRMIGECDWDGAALTADDTNPMPTDTPNVIDAPAMLTTLVTCH